MVLDLERVVVGLVRWGTEGVEPGQLLTERDMYSRFEM